MSVNPSDFIESARTLSAVRDEMSQRNSLSRAYYAAYHRTREVFEPEIGRNDGMGMHRSYLDQLQCHNTDSTERIVGYKLAQLYQRRIVADYRLGDSLRQDAVARQLDTAAQIFNLLDCPQASNQK